MQIIKTHDELHGLVPGRIDFFKFHTTVEARTVVSAVVNGTSIVMAEFSTMDEAERYVLALPEAPRHQRKERR